MTIEIDQSGKVEDTSQNTILAFSNKSTGAVLIPKGEKRKLQEHFRLMGKPRLFINFTFAAGLYFLLKNKVRNEPYSSIIIDEEYPGHTATITILLKSFLKVDNLNLQWKKIGKTSPAHDIAYKYYRKKRKTKNIVYIEDIWPIIQKKLANT